MVSDKVFEHMERALGCGLARGGSLSEHYRHHLAFAEEVRKKLVSASVPVRDMVDVQSLLFIAFEQADFWSPDGDALLTRIIGRRPAVRRGERPEVGVGEPYLSICAIYRDEAQYLAEWIEFHRLAGVDRFFLYDNGSVDDHRDVLAPYVEDGVVARYDWPYHLFPGQVRAYDDCIMRHRRASRWIAFIDLDEFLFCPSGTPLRDALLEYEGWPALGVNRATFYFSGHRRSPHGLVIESYRRRLDAYRDDNVIKSIVDPKQTIRAASAHHFVYRRFSAVDENHYPFAGAVTKSTSFERFRINHYYTKSEAEFLAKMERPKMDAHGGKSGSRLVDQLRAEELELGVTDDTILGYVDSVRERLGIA
jgi:hypothetical protein